MTEPYDHVGLAGARGREQTAGAPMTRRRFSRIALVALGVAGTGGAAVLAGCSSDDDTAGNELQSDPGQAAPGADGVEVVMYSSPSCGCCGQYGEYLREQGYAVDSRQTDDVDSIKAEAGVPEDAASCHTTMMGAYVVEGHVPVEAIDRLLQERPAVDGIALPGMPSGSPGMGTQTEPLEILSIRGGTLRPFMTVPV